MLPEWLITARLCLLFMKVCHLKMFKLLSCTTVSRSMSCLLMKALVFVQKASWNLELKCTFYGKIVRKRKFRVHNMNRTHYLPEYRLEGSTTELWEACVTLLMGQLCYFVHGRPVLPRSPHGLHGISTGNLEGHGFVGDSESFFFFFSSKAQAFRIVIYLFIYLFIYIFTRFTYIVKIVRSGISYYR